MKIIFVRNGKSNIKTDKLTLEGHLQAWQARRFLKDEDYDCIFCSPQIRALQTAKIINKKKDKPLFISKNFDERDVLPLDKKQYEKEYKKFYLKYNFESENYQTCKQFIDQIFSGMQEVLDKKDQFKTVVIVGHNSTLYGINAFLNGIPKTNKINWLQCSNCAVIKFVI